jgi:hypothetical protein
MLQSCVHFYTPFRAATNTNALRVLAFIQIDQNLIICDQVDKVEIVCDHVDHTVIRCDKRDTI